MNPLESFKGSYNDRMIYMAEMNKIPISGTFELLPFCNMRCEMCYIVHENTEEYRKQIKSVDEWEAIIDHAIEQGMLYCLITGGEPFLYPGIQDLLTRLSKKPIHIVINTNATLLKRETVEWLSKLRISRINISLYGASNDTYAKMCKNPKGFDQVIEAFRLLKEYKIQFQVHSTMIPSNIHDFDQMIDICNHFEIPLKMVWYMFPPYRKDQGFIENQYRFSPKEAAKVAFRILKEEIKDEQMLMMKLEANIACFNEPERYSLYGKQGVMCRGGTCNFWVNWRGQVSGCGINDIEKRDLSKESFKDAWPVITDSIEHTKMSEKCVYCKYRVLCPNCTAASYVETGKVDGTPDYLCEFSEYYAQLLIDEYHQLKEKYNG